MTEEHSTEGMHLWPKFARDAPGPGIGFHRNGSLSLNPEATKALETPKYVQLLVDMEQRLLAIRPCYNDDHEARAVVYNRDHMGRATVQVSTLGRSLGFNTKAGVIRLPGVVVKKILWVEVPKET